MTGPGEGEGGDLRTNSALVRAKTCQGNVERALEGYGALRVAPAASKRVSDIVARLYRPERFREVRFRIHGRAGLPSTAFIDVSRFGAIQAAVDALAGCEAEVLGVRAVQSDRPQSRTLSIAHGWFASEGLSHAQFSRVHARSVGAKRYFSLAPCPAGHVGWRYVTSNCCCECASPSDARLGTDAHVAVLLAGARARAVRKGLPFDLTANDIASLWPADGRCPVLGVPFRRALGSQGSAPDSPTLDRIVPELGYVAGNVMVVSARANRIRSDASVDEVALVAKFYRRLERQRR